MKARWVQVSNSLRLRVTFLPVALWEMSTRVKTNPELDKLSKDFTLIHVKSGF